MAADKMNDDNGIIKHIALTPFKRGINACSCGELALLCKSDSLKFPVFCARCGYQARTSQVDSAGNPDNLPTFSQLQAQLD